MPSASPSPPPRPPKQRLIRHRPFYQRWLQAPEDWYLRLENSIEALDWDLIQEALSYPLVVGLNGLMVSAKLGYWFDDPLSNVPSILRNSHSSSSSSYSTHKPLIPGFATLLVYLKSILILVSFLNTLWFLTSRRNYRMLQRSLHERPPTPNVRMVEISQDASHWSTRFPGWVIYPFYVLLFRKKPMRSQTIKVWEMSVWSPGILTRNIFCWFSPAQVLIMAAMDDSNFYLFAPLAAFVAVQVYYVTSVFESQNKDKQILFAEVYREYNQRFVYPRLFVQKYDKQVSAGTSYMMDDDTDDDDEYDSTGEEECHRNRHHRVPHRWPGRRARLEEEEEQEKEEDGDDSEDDLEEEDEQQQEDEEVEEEGGYEEPRIPHPSNALAFSDDDDDNDH